MFIEYADVGQYDLETALSIGETQNKNQQPRRRKFMRYTRLGNTGLIVSRLSFGAMTFGSDPSGSAIYKVDQENARAMIERSLEAGVNFFDTADMYAGGQSEVMLGEALGPRRRTVVIATKVGFRTSEPITQAGLSRRHILDSCDQSLKRLNTDYIDLYIVHKEDQFTPLEETVEALNDLVRMGKVRYLGFSNWSAWKAATALQIQKARGWAQFSSGQMYYSLVGRDVEHEIAPFMRYAGLGMTVWSPLAGGFLSGKYTRENLKDSENRLAGFDFLPFDKEAGFNVVDKMREIAERHNASVAQLAIAWLLAKPVVSSVIVGASKLHQLEDNLKAADLKLNDSEVVELDAITAPAPIYPNWFNVNLMDAQHEAAIEAI
jgi:aryl-alcohol dehydrogenase-like predicted oxidoreductase